MIDTGKREENIQMLREIREGGKEGKKNIKKREGRNENQAFVSKEEKKGWRVREMEEKKNHNAYIKSLMMNVIIV